MSALSRFACLVLLAGTCGAAGAREIFVAPDGSDASGDGTIDLPYGTLEYAVDAASSGDAITLRNGAYAGGVTVYTDNLPIRSHADEWAVVSAPTGNSSVASSIWVYAAGYVGGSNLIGGSCLAGGPKFQAKVIAGFVVRPF